MWKAESNVFVWDRGCLGERELRLKNNICKLEALTLRCGVLGNSLSFNFFTSKTGRRYLEKKGIIFATSSSQCLD